MLVKCQRVSERAALDNVKPTSCRYSALPRMQGEVRPGSLWRFFW